MFVFMKNKDVSEWTQTFEWYCKQLVLVIAANLYDQAEEDGIANLLASSCQFTLTGHFRNSIRNTYTPTYLYNYLIMQCIKSCRHRSVASVNVHIQNQNRGKNHSWQICRNDVTQSRQHGPEFLRRIHAMKNRRSYPALVWCSLCNISIHLEPCCVHPTKVSSIFTLLVVLASNNSWNNSK